MRTNDHESVRLTLSFKGGWWLYRLRRRQMGAACVVDGRWVLAKPFKGGRASAKRGLRQRGAFVAGSGGCLKGQPGGWQPDRLRGGPQ